MNRSILILASPIPLLILWMTLRNPFLLNYLESTEAQLEAQYGIEIDAPGASWTGWNGLTFPEVRIKLPDEAGALEIRELHMRVALLPLFGRKVRIRGMQCQSVKISLNKEVPGLPIPESLTALAPFNLNIRTLTVVPAYGPHGTLSLALQADSLSVKQPLLAESQLQLPPLKATLQLGGSDRNGNTAPVLSAPSVIRLGNLRLHPRLGSKRDPQTGQEQWQFSLTGAGAAQDLFSSLPEGAFSQVADMQVGGNYFSYLKGTFTAGDPESLMLETRFSGSEVVVHRFGPARLDQLDVPFTYQPQGSKRVLKLDPEAAGFTRLDEIAAPLQQAVLLAEDANFFEHHGVDTAILRRAVIDNLNSGAFERGGGTLTMQLVRNLFLNREKTLSRKAEEFLLTWLLDETQAVSKSRQLELYLNLVEWGPEIYGITEAAQFYFGKKPADLNLDESIFLAVLLPNPRQYRSLLLDYNQPGPFLDGMAETIKFLLWEKGLIEDAQMDAPIKLELATVAWMSDHPAQAMSAHPATPQLTQ